MVQQPDENETTLFTIKENGEETRFFFENDLNSAIVSARELRLSVHAYLRAHNDRAHTPENYEWHWLTKEMYDSFVESDLDLETFVNKLFELGWVRYKDVQQRPEEGVIITRNRIIEAVASSKPFVYYRLFSEAT